MADINVKIDKWKSKLLDLGKRNRLINYKDTKRSNIKVVEPGIAELWNKIVVSESYLEFEYFDEDEVEIENENEVKPKRDKTITSQSIKEQQKTLRNLRNKAKTAIEEQGVNILYLSFGFLKWRESEDSEQYITSPLILVPVTLTVETVTSPFILSLIDDEMVINPTLVYKLENDFGIHLPEFDLECSLEEYLSSVNEIVVKNKWEVILETGISLLSFLKINMYKDLDIHKDKIGLHPVIQTLNGDTTALAEFAEDFDGYDHDLKTKPYDIYQVVDADSSQQDAILCAKKGISFILQGPPGTGKSQTITNIISECLADGKKVLFVSEKMAALEVVHKRLANSKLADFCLTLHNHKDNKKEVLGQLKEVLDLAKKRCNLSDEAYEKLDILQINKAKLNEYSKDIHTPCSALNKTIYEINGRVANLYDYDDVIFSINNVGETAQEKLNRYTYLLNQFARTIGKMSDDYKSNPWQGSNVKNVSNELRHDIGSNLNKLSKNMKELGNYYDELIEKLEIEHPATYVGVLQLKDILMKASKSPKIPVDWIYGEDITPLFEEAHNYSKMKEKYKSIKSEIEWDFSEAYFELPACEIKSKFDKAIKELKDSLNNKEYCERNILIANRQNIVDYLTKVLGLTEGLIEMNKIISQSLGVDDILGYKCFVQILPTLDNLIKLTKVLPDWFDSEKFKNTQKTIQEAKIRIKSYNESIDSICKEFEKGILSVDYQGIYARFKTEYTSVFRIFNSNYKTDKNQIRSLYKTIVKKMDDKFVIKTLDKLRSIEELKQWIDENNGDLVSMLGEYYNKEHTDFEYIENAINLFNDISNHFSGKVPIKLRELILSGNKDTIKHIYNKLKVIIDEELLDRVDTTLSLGRRADDLGLEELKVHLSKASQELQGLINSYDKMSVYAKDKTNIDNIVQGICKLSEMQEISKQIENKAEELKKNYEFLYNGINTDWEVILDSLTWARDFKNTVTTCENKRKFVEKICSDEVDIANSEKYHNVMQDKLRAVESEWKWYLSLFEEDKDFNNTSIFALVDRIEKCANGLSLLEEWIDFRNSREMCKEEGLDEYIDKVETMGIEAKHIVPIFSKRFYRLWLDAALLKFPSVLNFRTRVHQETINEFASLDKLQLEIARARVRKTLIDKLPNVDKFTSGKDEISILKRELNKQRKIMPLRKLFKEIPNLILTLKPCLMMSPLSVSLFLEAESYNFDVVVFDEASQVCTEDAIGAILRGSQVIIAGDSKQLPPTSFFTASTSDDEMYDTDCDDEQEDDANAYESILDEAGLLPERTLLWHYRSRHEHLIAFSNAKIYKNNLITFPSNIDKIPDNGVEFVYVKEGYYDRGGKKGNVAEAKRVAELVFEHFKKFPGRSLGVIAFGEVQQQAIDYAIRQIRVKSQQFESFFNEDKEDAFFVKNLENVQGDERDTIIFSIGYAKDAAGKMYMNFGPLSKGGGERRLNVAITRAKYNVKLVGSIMPTDIEIEKISSEGPKLLRSYIDFAINGPASILRETSESQHAEHDSTFEEAVYKFLDRKGYKIGTQVGCSGYRIDMTVKHPTISGRYVLGIECDGAAYHSARTARERDRLRQAVLEDMGWKIYRIWSTDWIKDPVTEGQKLLNAVESAIAEYTEKDIGCSDNNEKQVSDFLTFENISINESKGHRQDNIYGFEYYKESLVRTVSRDPEDAKYIANVIQYVVDNEGPINFELICKRIACLFGNQKATIKVRSSAEYVLKNYLVDFIVKKGDFCYSKNDPTVKVRIPDPNSEIRPINYISIEEIAEAMFVIAGKYVGITSEGLYAETARAFGFNRTGANIVPAMKNACEYLIESGRAKEIGEKIIINNL